MCEYLENENLFFILIKHSFYILFNYNFFVDNRGDN